MRKRVQKTRMIPANEVKPGDTIQSTYLIDEVVTTTRGVVGFTHDGDNGITVSLVTKRGGVIFYGSKTAEVELIDRPDTPGETLFDFT